jgi:PAS domain S-box-containing protein
LIDVNDAACHSLGYTRDELLTKQVSDFERGIDPAMLKKAWAGMSEGQAITVQGEHHRKDGSRFPIEARVSLLVVDGDKHFLALVRDMTDHRQAELTVRESEQKYRTLVETSHDLIWSVDVEGRFTFVNQASRATHGYEPEEMIGRRFTEFMTEE